MQNEAGKPMGELEMTHPRNARFWTLAHGSPVKITLKPGQSLAFGYSDRADEGWSSYHECSIHTGDAVFCDQYEDGIDCDGRMSSTHLRSCPLPELMSGNTDYDPAIVWPAWGRVSASQRDYAAEAAGY